MKRWITVLGSILVFSLAFSFMCIGYAAVSRDIRIEGQADHIPPETIFIIDAKAPSNGSVNGYVLSTMSSSVTLANSGSSTARFEVTVYNNTDEQYGYNATKHPAGDDTYTNPDIRYRLIKADSGEELAFRTPIDPKMHLTFYVEFYYEGGTIASSRELSSVLLFEFLPMSELPEDEEEVAVRGALEKFKEILNTPVQYDTLSGAMDAHSAGNQRTYIGNVVGAKGGDSATVEALFEGELTLNINGEDKPMTTLIKRENIDGSSRTGDTYDRYSWWSVDGCEMVLYMTDVDLTNVAYNTRVTVYAAVFTCQQDSSGNPTGQWYQIGELFKGTAPVVKYEGGSGTGSFNTDSWRSDTNKTIENMI